MVYNTTIDTNSVSSSLEQWASNIDFSDTRTSLEQSSAAARGKLAQLNIGGENFATRTARESGIPLVTVENVVNKVDRFFEDSKLVNPGCESLSRTASYTDGYKYIRSSSLDELSGATVKDLAMECLGDLPERNIKSTVSEIAAIMSNKDMRSVAFENLRDVPDNCLDLYDSVGARAYGHFAARNTGLNSLKESLSNESFGATINDLNINNRLAVAVSILRNFSSTIDKLFARVTDESNTVTMTIPSPVLFSLERMNYHKSTVRNDPHNWVPLVNLHAEPGMANTSPQPVMENINTANDDDPNEKYLDETSLPGKIALMANGKIMNLSDLSANANRYGYDNTNHTDSIAEGGSVKTIIVRATQGSTSETILVKVGGLPGARFITLANNSDSSETAVIMNDQPFNVNSGTTTPDGKPTQIFKNLGKANIRLSINFDASLRLKYCDIRGSGSITPYITPLGGVSEDAAASDMQSASQLIKNVKFEVVSFIPELFFNEENLRKTTVSARVDWVQRAFQIPQGKNFTVDTAMTQSKEEGAIEAVQTAMSIGNSDRGMSVLESRLEETADILESAKSNPEVYRINRLQNLSYAGTLCRPYVLRAEADYNQLNVSVMRESERLTDKHAKMSQILLNGLANVATRSLYTTSMNPGERVVFKALMHSVTADLLFGIPSYHPTLEDAVPKANGADYSFVLDNGTRIDVVKTNFHNWQGKIAVIPSREDDPTDILNFATIRDRGVFAGTVNGADYNGSTVIRDVVNSREFVLVTNPIGMILNVENVDNDLGQIDLVDAI